MSGDLMQVFFDLAEGRDSCVAGVETLMGRSLEDKQLDYTWKRLVKGLPSNRKQARSGFAVALTSLLREHKSLKTEDVIQYCRENCLPSGHVSHKEVRDLYAGYVFCTAALLKSGRLVSSELQSQVISELLSILLKQKLTIKDTVYKVLIEVLDAVEDLSKVLPLFSEELKLGWPGCTTERLALISYFDLRDTALVSKLVKRHWNFSHLHHPQNYEKINGVLQKLVCEERIRPQLDTILGALQKSKHFSLKKAAKVFFNVVPSGDNKNTVMFTVSHLVKTTGEEKVEGFVVKHMSDVLGKSHNQSPESVRFLTSEIKMRVCSFASTENKLSLVKGILALKPRRASCLNQILTAAFSSVPSEDCEKFCATLQEILCQPGEEDKVAAELRSDCLTWMVQVLRQAQAKVVFEVTKFLFVLSFFEVKSTLPDFPLVSVPEPALSKESLELCRSKFNTCLKILSNVSSSPRVGLAEDGRQSLSTGGHHSGE
eukprot:sb/3464215/